MHEDESINTEWDDILNQASEEELVDLAGNSGSSDMEDMFIMDFMYGKRGHFWVGVILAFSRFCLLRENYPTRKLNPYAFIRK